MKYFSLVCFVCIVCTGTSFGRDISGRVLAGDTRLPLSGAVVAVSESHLQTLSGEDGKFRLANVPPDVHSVTVRFIGYKTATVNLADSAGDLTIVLNEVVLPARGVVVTATRARENETPITYATVNAAEIKERYTVKDIPVLLSELPSTTYYSESGNGIGYTYLNIRGFDQRRISVMINGVPQNDPEDHSVYWLDFPDLASNLDDIQVQRGAGSMTIGAPAIGGSINLVTTNFAREKGVYVSAGEGTFNTRKYSLSAHSGVIDDRYAIYARLSKITSDGYRNNSWVDFGSYFLGAVRFDKNMSTQINLYGGPVADHLAYYGIPKADLNDRELRKTNPIERPEEIENFSQPHYEIINEWQPSPGVSVNNTIFYVNGNGFFDYDGSWAPYSYYRITRSNGFDIAGDPDTLYIPGALIHAFVENNQYGWVPRVSIDHAGGTLIVGGELRLHRSEHWGSLKWGESLPAGVTPDYRYYSYHGAKTMASLYAHDLYKLSDRFMAMGDVQLAYAAYRLYDEMYLGTDFRKPYLFLNPKLGINYSANESMRLYATVSRTSREPTLVNLYDAAEASTPASWGAVTPQFRTTSGGAYDFASPLVKEETMNAAEFGSTYSAEELSINLNAYIMQFDNEIVKSGRLDRFGQPVTGNARNTMHRGLELSAHWRPVRLIDISGNATLSRNTFVHHTEYDADGTPIVLDGRRIAGFPDALANARITVRPDPVTISLAVRHVGKFYTTNREEEAMTVDPFTVADLSASYTVANVLSMRSIEFRCEVTNLFDTLYAPNGEGTEFFPAATRAAFVTVGIEL
jgi:iron complex outermembrane recepter protein